MGTPKSNMQPLTQEIASADRLLIVAAAGLSISQDLPNNPYHNPADFARHYPAVVKYGYRTGYDAMSLSGDEQVPKGIRLAFTARHFLNMRSNFPPTPAYTWLHQMASSFNEQDVFCWTSNVDGCFARAGFNPDRVYTCQGEMNKYQCADVGGCGHVWNCESQLQKVDAAAVDGVLHDCSEAEFTRCPKCGNNQTLPNLRGGDWFQHSPYLQTQERLLSWLDESVSKKLSVAVLEIGVGPNTPIVTSIPASAFASAVAASGAKVVYLRVNPDAPNKDQSKPAESVSYHRWQESWSSLQGLVDDVVQLRANGQQIAPTSEREAISAVDSRSAKHWQKRYTDVLKSLRTPR